MEFMWVRDARYFWCACPGATGSADGITAPKCFKCPEAMALQRGTRGRWDGRWFWYCEEHRYPGVNRPPTHLPGPGTPGKLHGWGS